MIYLTKDEKMLVTLEKLSMEGFLSYKEKTSIEFPENTIVIIGENGAGKTSIVEAIYYALTGTPLRGTLDSMINSFKDKMRVELTLRTTEGKLKIIRTREKKTGRTEASVYLENRVLARSSETVNRIIAEKLLGLTKQDRETGKKTIKNILDLSIIRQGYLSELSDKLSSKTMEKEKHIDILLGLDLYEKAYNALKNYETKVKIPETLLQAMTIKPPERYRITEDSLATLTHYVAQLKKSIEEEKILIKEKVEEKKLEEEEKEKITQELKTHEETLEKIEEREKKLEEKKIEYIRIRTALEREENEIRKLDEKLRQLKEKIETKKTVEKEYFTKKQEKEEKIKRAEKYLLEKLMEKFIEKNRLKKLHDELLRKYKAKKTEDILEEVKRLEKSIALLQQKLKETKEKRKKINELEEKEKQTVKELLIHLPLPTGDKTNTKLIVSMAKDLIQNTIREGTLLREKLREMEAEEESIREIIAQLRKEGGKCPVCGRKLTPEQAMRIISEHEKKLEKIKKEKERIKNKLEEISSIESRMENISKLSETLASIFEQKRMLEAEMKAVGKESEQYVLMLIEKRNATEIDYKTIVGIEDKIKRIEGETKALIEKIAALAQTEMKCDIEEECIKKIENRLQGLKDAVGAPISYGEIGFYEKVLEELEEKLNELKNTEKEYKAILEEKRERETLKNKYESILSTMENIEIEVKELKEKISREKEIIQKLKEERIKKEEKLRVLAEEIEKREKLLEGMRDLLRELEKTEYIVKALLFIRTLFNTDNLPKQLRSYAIGILQEEMKEILTEFELSYDDVEVSETLDITLFDRGANVSRSLGQCSGGEKTAIVLSFLIALKKTVQEIRGEEQGIGFMILDEPTLYLDKERRNSLLEILRKARLVSRLPQLIIITHDDELKDAGETVYLVERDRISSRIKRLYG